MQENWDTNTSPEVVTRRGWLWVAAVLLPVRDSRCTEQCRQPYLPSATLPLQHQTMQD